MKIRLVLSDEKSQEIREYLESLGIEIDDNADFLLTEINSHASRLYVKTLDRQNKCYINTDSIIYFESFGHDIYIHTTEGDYITSDPIRELEYMIDPIKFIRVSSSVIVSRLQIKEIRPSLYKKYTLVMSDKKIVDVTRSYYDNFKKEFRI